MIFSYFLIAWRTLIRRKGFMVVNILGLALGIAACGLIWEYVTYESKYDKWDDESHSVFRVQGNYFENGTPWNPTATSAPAFGPALFHNFPEVISFSRLAHTNPFMPLLMAGNGDRFFREEKAYYADSSFLSMMGYGMKEGDAQKALTEPNSVVLSQSAAERYFGTISPVGESLSLHMGARGTEIFKVTGVYEDVPPQSHVHPEMILSFITLSEPWNLDEQWDWEDFYTYLKLGPETDVQKFNHKLPGWVDQTVGPGLAKHNIKLELSLLPISQIHLQSSRKYELEPNADGEILSLLGYIGLFVLLIAWINYINLSTARSTERAKEVGVRKVLGSPRSHLVLQFMLEASIINSIAVLIAFTLIQLLLPGFSEFTGKSLTFSLLDDAQNIWVIGGILIAGTCLSGFYPAWVISGFSPAAVLYRRMNFTGKGISLRRTLVVFQFMASAILLIVTLTIYSQLRFMENQDLGLNMDQMLVVNGLGVKSDKDSLNQALFRQQILAHPEIVSMAISSNIPGRELDWERQMYRATLGEESRHPIKIIAVDPYFLPHIEMELLAGRNFDSTYGLDKDAVIFNQAAADLLGFESSESAVNQPITWQEGNGDFPKTVIGVIGNYHQRSPREVYIPTVFVLKKHLNAPWAGEYYSLRISPTDLPETLKKLEEAWAALFAGNPFDYFFLDDFYGKQYEADQKFGQVVGLFALLAVFIACLGLLGLAAYTAFQRTREIGIRKVLGASTQQIILLLTSDFLRWIVVASVLALPIAYQWNEHWLSQFAFHIPFNGSLYIFPIVLLLIIAIWTVSFRTFKIARINPAESLRDD